MNDSHPLGVTSTIEDAEAWLSEAGTVFTVFDQQDSHCVSYGLTVGDESWFVKVPTTRSAGESTRRAVR